MSFFSPFFISWLYTSGSLWFVWDIGKHVQLSQWEKYCETDVGRPQHNWGGELLEALSGEAWACSCFLISGRGMELADCGCFEQPCGFVVIQCNIIWESIWIPDVGLLFPGWDVLWKQRALLQNSQGDLPCRGKTGEQTLIQLHSSCSGPATAGNRVSMWSERWQRAVGWMRIQEPQIGFGIVLIE